MKIKIYFKYILQNTFAGSNFCPISLRQTIYRMLGHHIKGKVGRGNFLGYGPKGKLTIGGAVLVMPTVFLTSLKMS